MSAELPATLGHKPDCRAVELLYERGWLESVDCDCAAVDMESLRGVMILDRDPGDESDA